MNSSVALVNLMRGAMTESIHTGDIAVVNAQGELLAWAGSPREKKSYWRSSAKPFQAIPVVESGAIASFGISENELSQMCASHAGEDVHIATVRGILQKIGLDESYLRCGSHLPTHMATQRRMIREEITPTEVHCNCSGKHSGMLALATEIGVDLATYTELSNPVQQLGLEAIAAFTGTPKEDINLAIDGCGVPVHGLSIYNMALAWARLVDPSGMASPRQEAAAQVRNAMMKYPYLVAGEGRNCTILMEALPGRLVAKSGADAVYCVGLPEKGWGIALKIADGGSRAVGPAIVSVLQQLGVFTPEELAPLERIARVTLTNHRKEQVGELRPVFQLQYP